MLDFYNQYTKPRFLSQATLILAKNTYPQKSLTRGG